MHGMSVGALLCDGLSHARLGENETTAYLSLVSAPHLADRLRSPPMLVYHSLAGHLPVRRLLVEALFDAILQTRSTTVSDLPKARALDEYCLHRVCLVGAQADQRDLTCERSERSIEVRGDGPDGVSDQSLGAVSFLSCENLEV